MKKLFFNMIFGLLILGISMGNAVAREKPRGFEPLFDEICGIVEDNFYSPAMVEEKFKPLKENGRINIRAASNQAAFSEAVNTMLSGLHTSHTYYLSPDDYEYYQLAAVFFQLPSVKEVFRGEEVTYPTVGILTRTIDKQVFITSVLPGSAAEQAGLLSGDEIVAVDGVPYEPIGSIEAKTGAEAVFSIRRKRDEGVKALSVTPRRMNPKTEMLEAENASIRVIENGGRRIGYIHIFSYAGQEFQEVLVPAISWGNLKDTDALIIDLRYGLGGADLSYLNIFNPNVPIITATDRTGKSSCYDPQWRKPTVFLVNQGTRSGKEILAFGARKYGLATVIGERTAGAVSAGQLFPLSTGDFLYLAVRSSRIDGEKLEGVGVVPDIEVPMDIRYCVGKDIQLEKAVAYLSNAAPDNSGL